MFAAGSRMSWGRLGLLWALNVGGMTWTRPCDGVPRLALMSVRLTAAGLPPDSKRMRMVTSLTYSGVVGWPSIRSTHTTVGFQRVTLSPGPVLLGQVPAGGGGCGCGPEPPAGGLPWAPEQLGTPPPNAPSLSPPL